MGSHSPTSKHGGQLEHQSREHPPPGGAGQAEARGDPVHNAAQGGKGSNCSGGEEDKKFGNCDQIKLNNVPVASECSSSGIGETNQFHFQRTGGQTEGSWDL